MADLLAMTSQHHFKWEDKHTLAFECLEQILLTAKPQKGLIVNEKTLAYDNLVFTIVFSHIASATILGHI